MGWNVEEQILWIESLLTELTCAPNQHERDIWLAHRRFGQSHAEIAKRFYPRFWNQGQGKRDNQRGISFVRRIVVRVDKYLAETEARNQQRQRNWGFSGGCGFCDIE